LFRVLPRGSDVLDLGCGCGVPDARLLSERFRVTGVDISDVQISRAKRLVPGARFLRADMTEVRFRPDTFAGIVCLYALIHVPLDEQRPLLDRMHRWLQPGGVVLLTTGEEAFTGVEKNWLGSNAAMYWSHADAEAYERWLADAGFEVLRRTHVPEGESGHALFLARKRAVGRSGRARSVPRG
jgi:SAM-dependent methyltransferase